MDYLGKQLTFVNMLFQKSLRVSIRLETIFWLGSTTGNLSNGYCYEVMDCVELLGS